MPGHDRAQPRLIMARPGRGRQWHSVRPLRLAHDTLSAMKRHRVAVEPVTVGTLLQLNEVRSGRPEVLNGESQLDRRVRWVHVADTEGIGALIEGGEVVLSTAAGFRTSAARVRRFLQDLEDGGATAVFIELVDDEGRPDRPALEATRKAAAGLALPVVVLRRQIKFVRVTHAAHRLIIGTQLARVERSRHVHEVFTQLNLDSADERRIVGKTAELLGRTVVLEDVAHRVLLRARPDGTEAPDGSGAERPDSDGSGSDGPGLEGSGPDGEGTRGKGTHGEGAHGEGPDVGWAGPSEDAQVVVGTAGNVWGRLVAPGVDPSDAEAVHVLERASQALTLARMAERDEADLLQRAQAGFLQALMSDHLDEEEARGRAAALGLRGADRYVPVAVRATPGGGDDLARLQLRERALLETWLGTARLMVECAVAAGLQSGTFVLLLGLAEHADVDETLTRLVDRVAARLEGAGPLAAHAGRGHRDAAAPGRPTWTVGVGPVHDRLTGGAEGIDEAVQVARAAAATHTRELPFYRFADIRLRGLVALLAGDPRLRTFAEAELGPLLAGGPDWGLDLLELYLRHGGNKSEVARAGHLSRQALYARLRRLETHLGVSLDDPESRAALHVAVLWQRLQTSGA